MGWLVERWEAIVAPKEVKAKKQIEVVDKAIDVGLKVKKGQQEEIEWLLEMYRELGLTEEEIREKLLPDIESKKDPLSVVRELAREGAVRMISEVGEGGDSASEASAAEEQ